MERKCRVSSVGGWVSWGCGLLTVAVLLLQFGCSTAKVDNPLTNELAGNGPDAQLEFWHQLPSRPVTCNDEAFHGLILFLEGEDPAQNYEQRVEILRNRKMLPRKFEQSAEQAVTRGTLAVAMARMLDVKGGLTMHLVGRSPRYATREMQYMKLLPPSSPHQTVSGTEFVGIIGRIEDYQRVAHPADSGTIRSDDQAPAPAPAPPSSEDE